MLLATTTESMDWAAGTHTTGSGGSGGGSAMTISASVSPAQNFTHQIFLIDAFEGGLKHRLTGHEFNPVAAASAAAAEAASAAGNSTAAASAPVPQYSFASLPFDASFSADSAFVLAGSRSGAVHAWSAEKGEELAVFRAPLQPQQPSSSALAPPPPITAVQFCPTRMQFMTADASGQILWWMPPKLAATTNASQATPMQL